MKIMRKLRISEIACVDRPAQEGARSVILKRAPEAFEKIKPKAGEKKGDYVSRFMGHDKMKSEFPDEKQRLAVAYSMFGEHKKAAADDTKQPIADAIRGRNPMNKKKEDPSDTEEEASESDAEAAEEAKTGDEAEPKKKAKKSMEDIEKKLAKAEKRAALCDAEKAFAKSLTEPEQDAFLDLTVEQRKERMAKVAEADPVVYTDDEGATYRKSDGRMVELAKRADAFAKAQRVAEAKVADAEYAKRASEELKHLPGATSTHVAMLKAIDKIEDKALAKKALEVLTAKSVVQASMFKSVGSAGGESSDSSDPEAQLEQMAKNFAKERKLDYHKAYDAVLKTEEGKQLYSEMSTARRSRFIG